MRLSHQNCLRLSLAAAAMLGGAAPAAAQTFSIVSVTGGQMGTIAAAASGVTVMQIFVSTTTVSGSGNYVSGTYTTPTVTVRCTGACGGASARVTVTRLGVNTGRAQTLTDIGVVPVSPATISGAANSTPGPIDVVMSGWSGPADLQFTMGVRMPILGDDASTATTASSQFSVAVANNPTVPSGGTLGTITATIRRALTITKVADLRFGTIIAPTSGTNYVAVDTSGNRGQADNSGNYGAGTVILVPSSYGVAQFTAAGEPSTTFSLTIPSSMTMSGPGSAISVTLNPSPASGTITLPAGGTTSLVIGGYFPISAGQATGSYTGSFTVTAAYN